MTMDADLDEELAFAFGVQAYIWGFPIVEMVRTCRAMTAVKAPQPNGRAPINGFGHSDHRWTHLDRDIVTPANDLLYSTAWLNLANGPVILSLPKATGRYFVIALLDAYSNNFRNLGPRSVPAAGAIYALIGPRCTKPLPAGALPLRCPTDLIMILGRTLVVDDHDVVEARALQQQFTLTPTAPSELPPSVAAYEGSSRSSFFADLGRAVRDNPAPETERGLVATLEQAGVLSPTSRPSVMQGLERAYETGRAAVVARTNSRSRRSWGINYKVGNFGLDYLSRSALAVKGLAGLTAEEAVYAQSDFDTDGERLSGQKNYVLRFARDELPPVDAFWSVSMYGDDYYFVENPIGRHAIGDRTPGLEYGSDGSLEIQIGNQKPKRPGSNWLPAPSGNFYLILRMYHPQAAIRERQYRIPPLQTDI